MGGEWEGPRGQCCEGRRLLGVACALAQLINTIDALLTLSLAWFVNIPTGGVSVVSSLHCGHGQLSAVMAHHFNLALDAQVVV